MTSSTAEVYKYQFFILQLPRVFLVKITQVPEAALASNLEVIDEIQIDSLYR